MDTILEFKLFYGISSVIPIYETILNRKHGPDKKHWMYDANGQVLTLFPTTTFSKSKRRLRCRRPRPLSANNKRAAITFSRQRRRRRCPLPLPRDVSNSIVCTGRGERTDHLKACQVACACIKCHIHTQGASIKGDPSGSSQPAVDITFWYFTPSPLSSALN